MKKGIAMQLTNLQLEKVNQIFRHYADGIKKVDFKAPTGSGKTLMAISVLAKMMNEYQDKKFIFIIATLSSSKLPEAFENKINEYKPDLDFSDFEAEHIESPSSVKQNSKNDIHVQLKPVKNKVYIFGKSTFGEKRIFTEQNIIVDFIQECKSQGFTLVYLRDEAHIGSERGTNKKEKENFERLMEENADFILRMTAIFNKKELDTKRVCLTEAELNEPARNDNKYLLKTILEPLYNDSLEDRVILEEAIEKFKEIKKEYSTLGIRPAMLLQVDNEPSKDLIKKEKFFETLKMAKTLLTENGLSWVQYFGNNDKDASNVDNMNFSLSKITRNNDTTDCIIFKIGPSTGWDIPRACMLLQLRNICSDSLRIQTIGRIKRNPYPNLEKNPITDKYYLYSNEEQKNDKDSNVYEYKVKQHFLQEKFVVIKIKKNDKDFCDPTVLATETKKFLEEKQYAIAQRISDSFKNNTYQNPVAKIYIQSAILLLKLLEAQLSSLQSYQKNVLGLIKEYYQQTSLKNYKLETIWITVLSFFKNEITNIVKHATEGNVKYELAEEAINPDVYMEIMESTAENKEAKQVTSDYLFDIKKNAEPIKLQVLDSSKEQKVWEEISAASRYRGEIKVWAKNQTTGNIYGEYLDESSTQKKSYFDFIIKFNNQNLLYIEVKGDEDSDINRVKTEQLKHAYKQYFSNPINTGLFQKKFVICLAEVNKEGQITQVPFYDRNFINEDLAGKNLQDILMLLAK